MPAKLASAEALLATVDSLIEKHGSSNPELLSELRVLRDELQVALKKRDLQETFLMTLRIASWVRYVSELFKHF